MFIRIDRICAIVPLVFGSVMAPSAVQAQSVRYVASNGDNANNCTREAPCRTLQRGVNKTSSGGVLQILDSGSYGNNAKIKKSITIVADGVSATVGGLIINAPGETVALRGLLLNGTNASTDTDGILISAVGQAHIVRCEIERFPGSFGTGAGLRIQADGARVLVSETTIRDNAGPGIVNSSTAIVNIESSTLANNGAAGISQAGAGQTTVERSVVTGHQGSGFGVGGGTGRVSNSVFTDNGVGLSNGGGNLLSRGNNTVSGNTQETNGTIDPLNGV